MRKSTLYIVRRNNKTTHHYINELGFYHRYPGPAYIEGGLKIKRLFAQWWWNGQYVRQDWDHPRELEFKTHEYPIH